MLLGMAGLDGIGMAYALAHLVVAVAAAGPLLKRLKEKEATC
ncbi:hypothetical membrane protein [Pelotomaculum thermopropionicum SI]|uniref:Hypothetical membrane protein n=1 Tax=Pelotomaculum thermopropionicum (strain DSM 13744 / JCM 10971 / SI) TaxID=370438 RepID=A5D5C2_PELTS|nr:hypothetical membrane protein [Pelotomaculum thermopropionicum SI]